jgi:membrane protease YdiL (CAAX protease family)
MEALRPRGGDLTLAALVAGMIYVLALGGQPVAFPRGTAAEASFLAAYLPLIDPLHPDARHLTAVACALLCALEELVLRALVQPALERSTGVLRAWLATAVLDVAAWIPAGLLLADARIGFNPLLVGFAGVAAIATGWLLVRTDRVVPAALARALAAWALIEFPIWHP